MLIIGKVSFNTWGNYRWGQYGNGGSDMSEIIKDMIIVLFRIVTILPLLLFVTLFMGKRAIGQLPIFDFLVILSLGAVVGADIADPKIEHIHTAVAIIAIGLLQKIVAKWKISHRIFGKWITFEPTIVIHQGYILKNNLKRVQYSIDNILEMLREKDVFDMSQVEIGIVESNGTLSVLLKSQNKPVSREDLKVPPPLTDLSLPVILEGVIQEEVLSYFGQSKESIQKKVTIKGIYDIKDIFIATLNQRGEINISTYNQVEAKVPPFRH